MHTISFNTRALIANFVIWGLFIGISLSASVIDSTRAGREVEYLLRTFAYLVSFGPWMLITPVFYWLLNKNHQRQYFSLLLVCFLLLLCWSPFVALFESLSYRLMTGKLEENLWVITKNLPLFYWVYCLVLFGVVLGACLAVLYYRRSDLNRQEAYRAKQANAELELKLSELHIQSLLAQLEPHFLFNSLNSIASLVRTTDKKQALTAINQLSSLLRYALEAGNRKFVNFESELDFVHDYLALQSLRFAEKLHINIQDRREQKNQECPPFLLQVLVENAIKHGLEESGCDMQLSIQISQLGQTLQLSVENSLPAVHSANQGMGIGLTNLKARLNILYDRKIPFTTLLSEQLYRAEINLPAHRNE